MTEAEIRPIPAVGVVCLRDEAVLLIRRGQPPRQGEWSLPGGRIEWGEPARAAALRELAEETGVEAEIVGLVDVVDGLFETEKGPGQGRHYLLVDYAALWRRGEPRAGDDAQAAAFVALSEVAGLGLWSETMRVIEAARVLIEARISSGGRSASAP